MSEDNFFVGLIVGAVVAFVLTFFVTAAIYDDNLAETRAVLVERGYAEWVADPRTGKTTFKIKECVK